MSLKNLPTITAIATAQGTAGIGIIRLSGSDAFDICSKVFQGKNLEQQKSGTIQFGKIVDSNLEIIDEVLVSVFKNPHSYTGEDLVEINCHGSYYILNEIIHQLVKAGARIAEPGEFTQRAFLNGKMDLSQAEAVADLIHSETKLQHQFAINQMRGGIKNTIAELRNSLLEFASLMELELDFSEEDVEFADRTQLNLLIASIKNKIVKLLQSFSLGNAVKFGISTVIAGKPNAGKSTLLNALLEEERAIVSDIPGTTRDTIEEKLNINGIVFRLIDTAGLRKTKDVIEKMGVDRSIEKIQTSSILIYVIDVTESSKEEILEEISRFNIVDQSIILIANKIDLNSTFDTQTLGSLILPIDQIIPCSAKNKMNIELIKAKLFQIAIDNKSISDTSFVINARHRAHLLNVVQELEFIDQGLKTAIETDLLAQSMRNVIYELGSISGQISSEEILGAIFSRFCIGK